MSKPKIIAVIPARGGSKGLPGKNIKPVAGKPLIAYSIEFAKQHPMVDRVILSTDSQEIADVAKKYGAEVPFLRPESLAADNSTTESVLIHAVEWLEKKEGYKTDIVVFLQPTDIFRKKWMLDSVIQKLVDSPDVDSAFVAYETHKNFWRIKEGKPNRLADIPYGPRQKREHVFREDTGLACATRVEWIKKGCRIGPKSAIIPNKATESFIDIEDDFTHWLAEQSILSGKVTVND